MKTAITAVTSFMFMLKKSSLFTNSHHAQLIGHWNQGLNKFSFNSYFVALWFLLRKYNKGKLRIQIHWFITEASMCHE